MSLEIPVSFVTQFSANVAMLAEQKMSRLRNTVMIESVTGENFTVERMGSVSASEILDRHGDTPLTDTPHSRRWGFIRDFDVADLIDKPDRLKLLIQLDSGYTMKHAGAMGRAFDDEIIRALGASVIEGHSGGTTTAFDTSNQQIVHGSTGMTIQKILQAKEKLDAAEVDEFIPRFFVMGSRQFRELLEDDKVTSSDYNTVKALVKGDLNEYLGFTFIRSERLIAASSIRDCYAYAMTGIRMGLAQAPSSVANERPDKRNSKQIYTWGSWGAVRVEDVQVVQVQADES